MTVSRELTAQYGCGFGWTGLTRMVRFAQIFPDEPIVVTLSQELAVVSGAGFHHAALTRMFRCAERMTDEGIVSTLSTQLSRPYTSTAGTYSFDERG